MATHWVAALELVRSFRTASRLHLRYNLLLVRPNGERAYRVITFLFVHECTYFRIAVAAGSLALPAIPYLDRGFDRPRRNPSQCSSSLSHMISLLELTT